MPCAGRCVGDEPGHGGPRPRSRRAQAVHLDGVTHRGEAVRGRDRLRPALHGIPGHLDREPARAADDVVVVVGRAGTVDRFALGGADDVDLTVACHRLEVSVHGRETDPGARADEVGVDLLGRPELRATRRGPGRSPPADGSGAAPRRCSVIGTPPPRAARARRSGPRAPRAGGRRAGSRRGRRARGRGARTPGPCSWSWRSARSCTARRARADQRGTDARAEEAADGEQDDRAPRRRLGVVRHDTPPTLHATPIATAHHRAERKLRAKSCDVAFGRIISALMRSSPTIRIDTTTVTAVSTARTTL